MSRWVAIAVGFAGVLVIIRPGGQGFHPAIFLTLLNAIMYAVFNMITRRVGADDHPAATQWIAALVPTVVLTPFALWQWQTPHDVWSWLFILSAGWAISLRPWRIATPALPCWVPFCTSRSST